MTRGMHEKTLISLLPVHFADCTVLNPKLLKIRIPAATPTVLNFSELIFKKKSCSTAETKAVLLSFEKTMPGGTLSRFIRRISILVAEFMTIIVLVGRYDYHVRSVLSCSHQPNHTICCRVLTPVKTFLTDNDHVTAPRDDYRKYK